MSTPAATKAALAATIVVTVGALALFTIRSGQGAVDARFAGWFLLAFTVLFALRVAGQLFVAARAPRWLPPMDQWNLMPYRLLLPIQIGFLAVMGWLIASFLARAGPPTDRAPDLGAAVVAFSALYAAAMVVRYVVRMARRPSARWFGGAIPIVFHWVLASFLYVFGAYHAAR